MDDRSLLEELSGLGLDAQNEVAAWLDVVELLAALDAIARDGAVALVKIDGERSRDRYTVVVTGAVLDGSPFRKDGDDLRRLLREAVGFYVAHRRATDR